MTEKLLPCKKCHYSGAEIGSDYTPDSGYKYTVGCHQCGEKSSQHDHPWDAVVAWNESYCEVVQEAKQVYEDLDDGDFFRQADDPERVLLVKIPGGWMRFRPMIVTEELEIHREIRVIPVLVDGNTNIRDLVSEAD
jgi:hypothetical protein